LGEKWKRMQQKVRNMNENRRQRKDEVQIEIGKVTKGKRVHAEKL
jgi:hypothetical protein